MPRDSKTNTEQIKEKIITLLKEYTRHKTVKLVHRGNAAIFTALHITKKVNPKPFILIPDQGGWISYKTYPKMLQFDIRTVHTNRGVIDLMDLERKAEGGAAFILTSFAGYFAEQSIHYIYEICKKNNCLLIEDASGSIGDKELCDGGYCDMIVGSFGKWKIADAGYGGFISGSKELLEEGKEAFSMTNFASEHELLLEKLENAPKRLRQLLELQAQVKEELAERELKVVHPELRGLNVAVRFTSDEEKERIIEYCEEKGFEHVECPNYTRLEEEAISIELKRLKFQGKKSKKRK
jgi:hypothetical protein